MKSCDNCTKCCEGYLSGQVRGIPFYNGKPCHFVELNKSCKIYENRPKDPCKGYNCQWLINKDIPEWMKPSEIDTLVTLRISKNKIPYIEIIEAGSPLREDVVEWFVDYCEKKNINLCWNTNGKTEYRGSEKFIKEREISA